MPVYSMTGYASVQHSPQATDAEAPIHSGPTARLGLEIRSVNSRFLDLSFRLPEDLRHLEPGLRELITRQIKRGKVEVHVAAGLCRHFARAGVLSGMAASLAAIAPA